MLITSSELTETTANPVLPSLVPTMLVDPADTAVTTPAPLTVATSVLAEDHDVVLPLSKLPLASFRVAVACVLPPTATVVDANETLTDATGTKLTVIVAELLWPSLVAVIVAVPALTPVTTPAVLMVATELLLELQATNLPVSVFPAASFVVAVAWLVAPTVTVVDANDTLTEATGTAATVTVADPVWPSLAAVIVAVPTATAITDPEPPTAATAELLDDQFIVRPDKTFPLASLVTALPLVVSPTVRELFAIETETLATEAEGVTGGDEGPVTLSAPPPPHPLIRMHHAMSTREAKRITTPFLARGSRVSGS